MSKITVPICNDCGKPHYGRSKSTDRCWCDCLGNFYWGEIEEEGVNMEELRTVEAETVNLEALADKVNEIIKVVNELIRLQRSK